MEYSLKELNQLNKGTMMELLQIEYTHASAGRIEARMPVFENTKQPMGILHGGASLALAETVGGLGSTLLVDMKTYDVKGAQLSANHIGSASEGFVYAVASLLHQGKNTHVWNIEIADDNGRPISTCRLTNFIIAK